MTAQPTYPNPHNRGRTPLTALEKHLHDLIRETFGGRPTDTHDLWALAQDVHTFALKHRVLYSDAPREIVAFIGGDDYIARNSAFYRFEGAGGDPVMEESDLRAWLRQRNRQAVFGVDGARDLDAPARATAPSPAPDFADRWPSAFEMYEAEMARLRAAANN